MTEHQMYFLLILTTAWILHEMARIMKDIDIE